jgi:integrase
MAKQINRLSARKVATLNEPGRHPDGGGLYLSISKNGGRRWVFLYRRNKRLREMGLGSARVVSLASARESADEIRRQLAAGLDPLAERHRTTVSMSFDEAADNYVAAHRGGWHNPKHAAQWRTTLAYASPVIGKLPVNEIDVRHITQILEPLWATTTETAFRLRGRIERVLDWAKVRGYRTGENPARWRGHLDQLLPRRSKARKHHPALLYGDVAAFMRELGQMPGMAPLALEFCVLTAARTGEALGARWSEIDLPGKLWIIPAERMKARVEHRVPLSTQAIDVLQRATERRRRASDYVFPGDKSGRSLSSNSMLMVLERMKRPNITAHGFRSTFRDWAAETTNFPHQVVEMALAHTIANKAEAAYRRGDLLAKRHALMGAWSAYCFTDRSNKVVVPLAKTGATA